MRRKVKGDDIGLRGEGMRDDIGREELKGMGMRKGKDWMREIGVRRKGRGLLHFDRHTPNANEYPPLVIEMDGLPPVSFPFLLGV